MVAFNAIVAQSARRMIDVLDRHGPVLGVPLLVLVVVAALVIAISAFVRARRVDERP